MLRMCIKNWKSAKKRIKSKTNFAAKEVKQLHSATPQDNKQKQKLFCSMVMRAIYEEKVF